MTEHIKMTVEMSVTVAQALALQSMFDYWSSLGSMGASRNVGFFCDGDGNFQPRCNVSFDEQTPELTDELRKRAISEDEDGNRIYDFDSIAYHINQKDPA